MDKLIQYISGDATQPMREGNKIIAHVCNDVGGWGKGFVTAISKRWPQPEKQYRQWFKSGSGFALGEIQTIKVADEIWVVNMIGQHKIYKDEDGNAPIRYEAITNALTKLATFAKGIDASIHMPRIGCGLAGGTWDKIEPIINATLITNGIEVFVYDFN